MLDLGIIIVNWNVSALLERCLDSVFASQGALRFQVMVVDNASTDDSVERLRARRQPIRLLVNQNNLGYSAANNLALREFGWLSGCESRPRYALLLNPDTELPPTALADMVRYLDERPELGAAGPKLILPDGRLDLACRRSFPSPAVSFWHFTRLARFFPDNPRFGRYNMTHIDPDVDIAVDSVVGAFMMVRAEAVAAAGPLDERFFMYGEDLDWAFRIQQAGWQIRYNPAVTVRHVKRASSRQSAKARREFYRAMWLFYDKHYRRETPKWLHYLVKMGILAKGGASLWQTLARKSTRTTRP